MRKEKETLKNVEENRRERREKMQGEEMGRKEKVKAMGGWREEKRW